MFCSAASARERRRAGAREGCAPSATRESGDSGVRPKDGSRLGSLHPDEGKSPSFSTRESLLCGFFTRGSAVRTRWMTGIVGFGGARVCRALQARARLCPPPQSTQKRVSFAAGGAASALAASSQSKLDRLGETEHGCLDNE